MTRNPAKDPMVPLVMRQKIYLFIYITHYNTLQFDSPYYLDQSKSAQTASELQQSGVLQQRSQEMEIGEVSSIKIKFEEEIYIRKIVGESTFTYNVNDRINGERQSKTRVFKGILNGKMPIALKRYEKFLVKMDESTAMQMIKELQVLSSPENRYTGFVRYFGYVEDETF